MYIGTERRQSPRYSVGDMKGSISFQDESSGKVCFERVKPVDFNSNGIAFETNLDFEMKKKISLDISKGRNHASDIICVVRNVTKQSDKNRYGLQFDFTANEYMRSEELEEILAKIEKSLKANQNLPSRSTFRLNKARDRLSRIKIIGR